MTRIDDSCDIRETLTEGILFIPDIMFASKLHKNAFISAAQKRKNPYFKLMFVFNL